MAFEIVHNRIGSDIWANARLRIIRKLVRDNNKLILDLGCGRGYVGKALGKSNKVVFAEIDASLVKEIKGMKVILDARKMPFKKDTFDYVICADVLEHIKEDKKALKGIYDILKKKGKAIIALPAYQKLYGHHDKLIGHYRRYNKKEFLDMAEEIGFKIKYVRYSLSFLFFPFLANQFIVKSNKAYVGKSSLEKKLMPLLNIISFIEANIKLPFGLNLMCVLEK
ncbi:MAG: methyltransferase domain-containing protein [archaeon]